LKTLKRIFTNLQKAHKPKVKKPKFAMDAEKVEITADDCDKIQKLYVRYRPYARSYVTVPLALELSQMGPRMEDSQQIASTFRIISEMQDDLRDRGIHPDPNGTLRSFTDRIHQILEKKRQEKYAAEQAAKRAAAIASWQKHMADKAAAERATAMAEMRIAAEKVAAKKAVIEKIVAEKLAVERNVTEKAFAKKLAVERNVMKKAFEKKLADEKALEKKVVSQDNTTAIDLDAITDPENFTIAKQIEVIDKELERQKDKLRQRKDLLEKLEKKEREMEEVMRQLREL